MILVEDRLKELFATLPEWRQSQLVYPTSFAFGTHEDLLVYMRSGRKNGGVDYPLIWLETPYEVTKQRGGGITGDNLKLIISTLSNSTLSNTERLETTIKPVLSPVYDNVIKALNKSGFSAITSDVKRTVYYNYAADGENKATDIWDAIKVEFDFTMTDKCLQTIKY